MYGIFGTLSIIYLSPLTCKWNENNMNVPYVSLLYFFINKVDNFIRFVFDAKMY